MSLPPLVSVGIGNYRSIRSLHLPVGALNVFVGLNGTGKTNLYSALALLREAAQGRITRAIAEDGGVASVLWAGERRKGRPVRLDLSARLGDLSYSIAVGLPKLGSDAALPLEPLVKEERLALTGGRRDVVLMERAGPTATLRAADGRRITYANELLGSETALFAFRDGARFPELDIIRRALADWRFHHGFRTDREAPLRRPALALTTPTLAADGSDLAAVFATLSAVRGDTHALDAAIEDAFPGTRLEISVEGANAHFALRYPDLPRAFAAHELSDGTLNYLALMGALLAYRLPAFVALNEPEASLHPDLLEPLARVVARACERTQVWIVTHSERFADALEREAGGVPRRIVKERGETHIEGLSVTGQFLDD
ncbi:MAG: ATPase [Stappia sp.]|mgnify:CR=1 FL=1|uniref:AAA family ATPase n=1 Tax=Stappia sp. TaxID=1870903 RepID=UPI000C4B21CA|nr:AAA family ATPase [Stappia sp.]MAB00632.1 ATPase [Stappia sp.]MBM18702.1 ATPase [Stappia sp.]